MSYRSRLYNHRNVRSAEAINDKPFFSKQNDGNKSGTNGTFFQAKLSVNKSDDKYEREADHVANEVVNEISNPALPVQRMTDVPEKNTKFSFLQAKQADASSIASPQLSSNIESSAGSGTGLPGHTLNEMNASFGTNFNNVHIHNDSESARMNKELHAQAFTHGPDIYFDEGKYNPTTADGKFLLAHELTHVIQQSGTDEKIQRDLAIEPLFPDVEVPILNPEQFRNARIFNNQRYGENSIRLIQEIVGGPISGVMEDETIALIALFQAQNGLTPDGMVGEITFNQMTAELEAEGASADTCLTMFRVALRTPMELHAGASVNTANIFGHFDVEIRFSPHCDCSRFEYRQFISGNVTLNGTNINSSFTIPPSNVLPPTGSFIEDGNTTLTNNGRYGHRSSGDNRGRLNQYLDASGNVDMQNGCFFRSFDEPGITGGPANSGDTYVFDFRFFGDIRKDGQMVERKFWSVRETVIIP